MGASAQQLFSNNNIEVIVGASGDCNKVALEYLKGELNLLVPYVMNMPTKAIVKTS